MRRKTLHVLMNLDHDIGAEVEEIVQPLGHRTGYGHLGELTLPEGATVERFKLAITADALRFLTREELEAERQAAVQEASR